MRRIKALLVALLMAAGFVLPVASPAQASLGECGLNRVCLWSNVDYTNLLLSYVQNPGTCFNVHSSINDQADSYLNNLSNGHHVQFYADANCTGHEIHRQNGSGPCAGGPYPVGSHDRFCNRRSGTHLHIDVNLLTSIWFNNG